jgi:hypothetical protein
MPRKLWIVMFALVGSACDDGSGGADRRLGDLSDGEVQQVCAAIQNEFAKTTAVDVSCTLEGAANADSAADCTTVRQECIAGGEKTTFDQCDLPDARKNEKCKDLDIDAMLRS